MSNSRGDIQAFCRQLGQTDPFQAVRVRSDQLRALIDGPPFEYDDLRVRQALQVQIKYLRGLTLDGRVYRNGSGFEVEINASRPRTRQRFTLAHELAHTFFMGAPEHDSGIGSNARDDFEENLCDYAATELLLPSDPMKKITGDFGPSLGTLLFVADTFKVSLGAAANRITQLLPHKCHIGFWRVGGGAANYESGFTTPNLTIAIPPGQPLDPVLLEKTRQAKQPIQQQAELGFISGRTEPLGRTYSQAFFLPSAQRVLTFTVFAKHSKFLLQRFAVNQYYARLFERLEGEPDNPQLPLFEF